MRDGEAQEPHLDVDELSSYAQNALPAAARARYTEHVAECSSCRKLVTQLSLSLGATTAGVAPVETVSVPSGLKKFLASLFSPMVLRYAVPALGLIIVAVIGFVALRQPARNGSVAQLNADERERTAITASPEAPPAPTAVESPGAGFVDPNKETANAGPAEQPKQTERKSGTVTDQDSGAGPVTVAPPNRDEKPVAEPQSTVEAAPPPAAKTAVVADAEEQKKLEAEAKKREAVAVAKKEPEISTSANEPVRGAYQRAPLRTAGREVQNKAKDAPAGGTASVGSARVFSEGRSSADKNDAETRTVSGRRFRKERGIWTDTAYDSSTATVNVARGSEQFRALVADEPEIKKIAEQLDGEVIVVWKSQAYRIR